jgi:FAD/FMN-containing dehydrogenase
MTATEISIPGFEGELSHAGPAFDEAVAVWNCAPPRSPALVAHCESAADVAAALRHARGAGLRVSVRAGGHSYTAASVAGDLVLDLRRMCDVRYDPDQRVVTVGGGAKWGEVDDVLGPLGLATAGGSVSKVGVAGFSLGTGFGWLGRLHGTAGDNLVGATVVTADAEILDVGAGRHDDLFWALRGGCGNFGVVTEFRFRVHPVGSVLAGPVLHRIDDAAAVLGALAAEAADLDPRVSWAALLTTAPPLPVVPADLVGQPVLIVPLLWLGEPADGEAALRPLRELGRPVADLVAPTPYSVFQRSADDAAPDAMCWDVRSEWLGDLTEQTIDAAVAAARTLPSPLSQILFRPVGGALARSAADTPFSWGHARHLLEVIASWAPGEDPTAARTWMEKAWQDQLPISAGGPCVNHIGLDEPGRVEQAYDEDVYRRLQEVKLVYDPDNLFRSVQNIPPPLTRPARGRAR